MKKNNFNKNQCINNKWLKQFKENKIKRLKKRFNKKLNIWKMKQKKIIKFNNSNNKNN